MTGLLINTEVLDRCRQAVAAEAGHLGGAGDTIPPGDCPASIFGRWGAAATMAGAVERSTARVDPPGHRDLKAHGYPEKMNPNDIWMITQHESDGDPRDQ